MNYTIATYQNTHCLQRTSCAAPLFHKATQYQLRCQWIQTYIIKVHHTRAACNRIAPVA